MLVAVIAAGVVLLAARRTYPRGVATARASNQGGPERARAAPAVARTPIQS